MRSSLLSIIKKEFLHIWYDPQTLLLVILLPLFMLLIFGYAITLDIKDISTVVTDLSQTPESRRLIEHLDASNFFRVGFDTGAGVSADTFFLRSKAQCVIVIPRDFSRDLQVRGSASVQVLIDASDPNAAQLISNYLNMVIIGFNAETNDRAGAIFTVEPRFLYNPDLRSERFFVPGLIAVIMLLIGALLTSIAVVREKEQGSMEQLLVSPVHPASVILGKVIPYTILGFLDGLVVLAAAVTLFDVPVNGSVALIVSVMVLYILNGLSLGLLISTLTGSQQIAMMLTLVLTILPTIMLSGFMFPLESMPVVFRVVSLIIPATHFIHIIRSVMLKGVGISAILPQLVFLAVLSFLLLVVSIKNFKTHLE